MLIYQVANFNYIMTSKELTGIYKCDIWPRAIYITLMFDIIPAAPFNTIKLFHDINYL